MINVIEIIYLFILVVCSVAAVRMKDLLSATVVLGAYSLIMAIIWMDLNAVDVAFTEASVGAGITTVLIIAALSRTKRGESVPDVGEQRRTRKARRFKKFVLFIVTLCTFGVLVYGTMDLPDFGDPDAPARHHVADRYIEKAHEEVNVENFVTAVLASYRGYDTLGETTVIFTAGLAIMVLLRREKS
ncbi:MAG: DUF4040 domain-containing protein [Proteobacteria bacterium]|nr:DUF4040 domain-containing protein [Pseudomonadota bacterium]